LPVVQLSHGPASSLHSKLTLGSVAENRKLAEFELVGPDGPESIELSGGCVSTVNVAVAGVSSTLPAPSVARTEKTYVPGVSEEYDLPELQGSQSVPGLSRHSYETAPPVAEKGKLAVVEFVGPEGPPPIELFGGVRSTVQLRVVAAPALPAVSVARVENV
jgi:hypothetical protein